MEENLLHIGLTKTNITQYVSGIRKLRKMATTSMFWSWISSTFMIVQN